MGFGIVIVAPIVSEGSIVSTLTSTTRAGYLGNVARPLSDPDQCSAPSGHQGTSDTSVENQQAIDAHRSGRQLTHLLGMVTTWGVHAETHFMTGEIISNNQNIT